MGRLPLALILLLAQYASGAEFFEIAYPRNEADVGEKAVVYLPRTAGKIELDGKIGDAEWQGAYRNTDFETVSEAKTALLLARDDQALYLAYRCDEPLIKKLHANVDPGVHDGNIWYDDCVDFCFRPNAETRLQFLANSKGAKQDFRNAEQGWNAEWQTAAQVGEQAWQIEIRMPWKSLLLEEPVAGKVILANFCRSRRTPFPPRRSKELSAAFPGYGKPTGLLVIGSRAERKEYLLAHQDELHFRVKCCLDKWSYSQFQSRAIGRIRVSPGPGEWSLLPEVVPLLALMSAEKTVASQELKPLSEGIADFSFPLGGLEDGDYRIVARILGEAGAELCREERPFTVRRDQPETTKAAEIDLRFGPVATGAKAWPVTLGVPFPEGALADEAGIRLLDASRRPVPCQKAVLNRWSRDGWPKWVQLHFQSQLEPEKPARYTVSFGEQADRCSVPRPLEVYDSGNVIVVDTGRIRFHVRKRPFDLIHSAWFDANGNQVYEGAEQTIEPTDAERGCRMVDQTGKVYRSDLDANASVTLEEHGPLRASIKAEGFHAAADGSTCGKYIVRIEAYAGQPFVRVYHTFVITEDSRKVKYRDIALKLGLKGESVGIFGSGDEPTCDSSPAHLLQFGPDQFQVVSGNGVQEQQGKARGIATVFTENAAVSLAVRNFWQNYPKELEAVDGDLVFHLWPAHGKASRHPLDKITGFGMCHLWYVHEGELLDFDFPEPLVEKFDPRRSSVVASALEANAMGLAKTHEMLLCFHQRSDTKGALKLSGVLQANPRPHIDPAWLARSGAFGPLQPKDRGKHPKIEEVLDTTTLSVLERRDLLDDYGMFNFGDIHQSWTGQTWGTHRHWPGLHHGSARWPWMLYFRSGDPAHYHFAETYTRHLMDVDVCHYATEEYNRSVDSKYSLKAVGGLCKYNGLVHWHEGGSVTYNTQADFLLWYYYLTGHRRALDVASEMGSLLKRNLGGQTGRGGAALACAALKMYQHTWDNAYLEVLENNVTTLFETQDQNERGYPEGAANYQPFLTRYWEQTRRGEAKQRLVRWADALVTGYYGWTERDTFYDILGYAYLFTRDPKYLAAGLGQLNEFTSWLLKTDDPLNRQCITNCNLPGVQGYTSQQIHHFLYALDQHGAPVEPMLVELRRFMSSRDPSRENRDYIDIYIRKKQGQAVSFGLSMQFSATVTVKVTDPAGKVVSEQSFEHGKHGERRTGARPEVALKAEDAPGDYLVTLRAHKAYIILNVPLRGEGLDKLAYLIRPEGLRVDRRLAWFYFRVPHGVPELTIKMKPQMPDGLYAANLIDERGQLVASTHWTHGEHVWTVKVPESAWGQIWEFRKPYCPNYYVSFLGENVPRFAAFRKERLYEPGIQAP